MNSQLGSKGDSETQPITEQCNPLSVNIDISSPVDIVSTLEACDKEIFDGWKDYPGFFSHNILETISKIVINAVDILKDPVHSCIIFSGCGTSGRIGFITARTLNAWLRQEGLPECYFSIVAGGDKALFMSQEAVEDDPFLGIQMLKKATEGKSGILFIGITCGLSAPFVAGQLDYCLKHLDRFTPVLIGFNPSNQARDVPIYNWNKTFLQVVHDLQAAEKSGQGFLLNPIVGPEPITGSSRMKSGTATKLLLETLFVCSHARCFHKVDVSIPEYMSTYRKVWEIVYSLKQDIANLLHLAGTSLISDGHIYYLGSDSLGIMALIDASECPPTYGATFDDVRGYLEGGYKILGNVEGDLSCHGRHFQISTEDFIRQVLPNLSRNDLVVFIFKDQLGRVPVSISESECQKACIVVSTTEASGTDQEKETFDSSIHLNLSSLRQAALASSNCLWNQVNGLYVELGLKWILNAMSTGAHIMKGKVFNNFMIDLKASNVKLFHRAIGIIQRVTQFPAEQCQEILLRSIYRTDTLSEDVRSSSVSQHVQIGNTKEKVVPIALLAALLNCSIQEAENSLTTQPVIRQAVLNSLQKHSEARSHSEPTA